MNALEELSSVKLRFLYGLDTHFLASGLCFELRLMLQLEGFSSRSRDFLDIASLSVAFKCVRSRLSNDVFITLSCHNIFLHSLLPLDYCHTPYKPFS